MALNKLTLKQVRALGDGLHSDGGNLYLRVRGSARSWIFRYRFDGNLTDLGLGSVMRVPLSKAREKAQELREQLGDGADPGLLRRRKARDKRKQSLLAKNRSLSSFYKEAIAHRIHVKQLRTPGYQGQLEHHLERYAFPSIGKTAIQDITKHDVFAVLQPLWEEHPSSASTVLTGLRACFSYAILQGWYEGAPPTEWKNCLDAMLPTLRIGKTHYVSIAWQDMPDAYAKILVAPANKDCVRDLVLATVLCATRVGELSRVKPEDIDLDAGVVCIKHRKDGKKEPFVVPIVKQAETIFRRAAARKEYAFGDGAVGSRSSAVDLVKRALKNQSATMHGFRSSFSTWCADNGKDPILREMCLCHAVDGAVASAYQRSNLLEPRRRLLQEWADWVTSQMPA